MQTRGAALTCIRRGRRFDTPRGERVDGEAGRGEARLVGATARSRCDNGPPWGNFT